MKDKIQTASNYRSPPFVFVGRFDHCWLGEMHSVNTSFNLHPDIRYNISSHQKAEILKNLRRANRLFDVFSRRPLID